MSKTPLKKAPPQIRSSTEFAQYVGLARTTVSRVLNGQPGLKQKTIDRVQRAIEETGFVPNAHALYLKGKRTAAVGICMETLLTPPLVYKLAALQKSLREQNLSSLIEVFDPENGRKVIRHFLSMRVDAVVFIGHFNETQVLDRLTELRANSTPHLIIDHLGIKGANTVALDRARGAAKIAEMLFDQGHRTFGLLGLSGTVRSTVDRVRGVREVLEARGLNFDKCTRSLDTLHVRHNDFEYGRLLANSFIDSGSLPTALIGLNDEIAIGALRGLQERNISVPKEVSVTGFNNQDICMVTRPTLTSVDQRIDATIKAATDFIVDQLGQPLRTRAFVQLIEPALVIRESTGPAR